MTSSGPVWVLCSFRFRAKTHVLQGTLHVLRAAVLYPSIKEIRNFEVRLALKANLNSTFLSLPGLSFLSNGKDAVTSIKVAPIKLPTIKEAKEALLI